MKNNEIYRSEFYTFDIETTTLITGTTENDLLQYEGIVWSGQFYNGKEYTQVRDLQGIRDKFAEIESTIIDKDERVLIFVHNLSYEFQFIKNMFEFTNILAYNNRKIISAATSSGLIFRCSYILSNMSLKKFLQNEEVEVQKGEMDYRKRRFPWTELTEEELSYCKSDVVGLHQAIEKRIAESYRGSIRYLPYTSTGYVRRDCKRAMRKDYRNRLNFIHYALDYDQFCYCREAFRGGNVHSNRFHVGEVLEDVFSFDKASSYPFELMTKEFPTKFYKMKKYTMKEFNYFLRNNYALLFRVSLRNVQIRKGVYNPYIPSAKCWRLSKNHKRDNGRILSADFLSITVTEVDWKIILQQYTFSPPRFENIYYSKKAPIPQELKDVIMDYYKKKTELKGVKDKTYEYSRAKAHINSIYGMFVTLPIKFNYVFNNSTGKLKSELDFDDEELTDKEIEHKTKQLEKEKLQKFYRSYNSFLSYQVGIWVTAYARAGYEELCSAIGDDFRYGDTDSVKGVNYEKHIATVEKINDRIRKESLKFGATAKDKDGVEHPMGVWEFEGISKYFKTFGSKKYLYGTEDDFFITIAGVPKTEGKKSIKEWSERTGNKWFDIDIGYEFKRCKLASHYNDYTESKYIKIDGHELEISSNIGLTDANYLLGYASDYEKLIRFIHAKVEGEEHE